MSEYLKNNIIYLRLKKGETQLETALALGLSRSTYANYEVDDNKPKSDNLTKISRHFGVTVQQLIGSDLTNGNLIFEGKRAKIKENSNLKGNLTGYLIQENEHNVVFEDPFDTSNGAQKIIDGLLLAIKALEASNSKHLEEIQQLKEQIIDLKREIPQIGTEMEGRNTMTA